MKTIRDFSARNKRILVRCDFNVPFDGQGQILDDFRIRATLPTIEYLAGQGAKIILLSHLGDPEGKRVENLSLSPIAMRLVELLGREVVFAPDCIGNAAEQAITRMQQGDIVLLENVRFYRGEEQNDAQFARLLGGLGDIFVQDAFGACHRAHASIVGIPKLVPAFAGLLLEKELRALDGLQENTKSPFVVIVGGKKAETKAKMIDRFSRIADWILVGHLIEKELQSGAMQVSHQEKLIFPIDGIEKDGAMLDIGSKTVEIFSEKIAQARTILWNGPLGFIEQEPYWKGSMAIAYAICNSGAFSVVGGGETVEFINRLGIAESISHVSTGGGAMLAYLSGEKLPGLEALGGQEK
jgi:phosphoglycerate kinase